MPYHIGSRPETYPTRAAAVAAAVAIAPHVPDRQCLIWDRPFHAIATVRHYPATEYRPVAETLIHRYGREQPGNQAPHSPPERPERYRPLTHTAPAE